MNEDYLWDKSGALDCEIHQLEEILGTLRYQPKPLRLAEPSPAAGNLSTTRRRNYRALLAIAATVAVALLAGGLWLRVQSYDESIAPVAMEVAPLSTPNIGFLFPAQPAPPKRHSHVLAKHDNQAALAAKQQLMFALRLASEKLNDAYRRTQTPSQIKNQHRAG